MVYEVAAYSHIANKVHYLSTDAPGRCEIIEQALQSMTQRMGDLQVVGFPTDHKVELTARKESKRLGAKAEDAFRYHLFMNPSSRTPAEKYQTSIGRSAYWKVTSCVRSIGPGVAEYPHVQRVLSKFTGTWDQIVVISCEEIWQNEVACIRPYLSELFLISCFLLGS